MKKYKVNIKEILERVIEIEANNEEEALEQIKDMYYNEDIVLDSEDFKDYEINIIKD